MTVGINVNGNHRPLQLPLSSSIWTPTAIVQVGVMLKGPDTYEWKQSGAVLVTFRVFQKPFGFLSSLRWKEKELQTEVSLLQESPVYPRVRCHVIRDVNALTLQLRYVALLRRQNTLCFYEANVLKVVRNHSDGVGVAKYCFPMIFLLWGDTEG